MEEIEGSRIFKYSVCLNRPGTVEYEGLLLRDSVFLDQLAELFRMSYRMSILVKVFGPWLLHQSRKALLRPF